MCTDIENIQKQIGKQKVQGRTEDCLLIACSVAHSIIPIFLLAYAHTPTYTYYIPTYIYRYTSICIHINALMPVESMNYKYLSKLNVSANNRKEQQHCRPTRNTKRQSHFALSTSILQQ